MNNCLKKILAVMLTVVVSFAVACVGVSAVNIYPDGLINGSIVSEKQDFVVSDGVAESYIEMQDPDGSNKVRSYVLEVDLSNPNVGIVASYKNYMNNLSATPTWGMQCMRDQAVAVENYYRNVADVKNPEFEVVAGVNADFFNMGNGAPRGSFVMNGNVYNVAADWPCFVILNDGSTEIRESGADMTDVAQCVGGPAVILKDGQPVCLPAGNAGYGAVAHPRTAVGIKADGSVVFVVSDGRQAPDSVGQTFEMMSEQLLALGCVDALCLDGGGSSSFATQREGEESLTLRNVPADGIERTVSTALIIYSNNPYETYNVNRWVENNGNVSYLGADSKSVTGTQTINGYTYTFDDNGVLTSPAKVDSLGNLVCNTWLDGKYYLGADGLPVKGDIKLNDGYTYKFDVSNGKFVKAVDIQNKWVMHNTDAYYYNADGYRVIGDVKIGEYNYSFDENGKHSKYVFVMTDGTIATNQWVGTKYYLGEDGLPVTGKHNITCTNSAGVTTSLDYTFGEDGKLIKGTLKKEENYTYYYIAGEKQRNWHLIDGYWHYFDRQTGFGMATADNCDKVYYDDNRTDGLYFVFTTDAQLHYRFDKQGRLTRGAWLKEDFGTSYYWGNHERATGWWLIEGNIYYFDDNFYMVTGNQTIDGKEYTFTSDGILTAKDANVLVAGKYYYFDSNGKILKNHITDHPYTKVIDEAVEPTEDSKGKTQGEHCDVCGFVLVKQDEIPAINHTHNYVAEVVEPTCTQDGYTKYTCRCGESYIADETLSTLHKVGDWETAIEPQVGVEGKKHRKCTVCGEVLIEDVIPALTEEILLGDVNGDGKVNAADARLALRISAKIDVADEKTFKAADFNKDGVITALDARAILRKAAMLD